MSQNSRALRRAAVAGVVVTLAAVGVASPAHADTSSTLAYDCTYPIIDVQPLTADVTTNIPSSTVAGVLNPAYDINVVAHAGGDTWTGLDLISTSVLRGSAFARTTVTVPGDAPMTFDVPVTIPDTEVPIEAPDDLTIPAFGKSPEIRFPNPGVATVTVESLKMNMVALKSDGVAIKLGSVKDSDKDAYTFDVTCVGPPVKLTDITVLDATAPTKPGAPVASEITTTGAKLDWTASTDNVGVVAYDVYKGATKVASVEGTTTTLVDLPSGTASTFTVVARDAAGNASDASTPVTVTTKAAVAQLSYALSGSAVLKSLTTGTVPLAGSATGTLQLSGGSYTGATALADASANLRALGFLPVSAVVGFGEVGSTAGTLAGGVLSIATKQDIRIKSVKLLGVGLVSGSCHTSSPSLIALTSGGGFVPAAGGTLTGTYDVAALTGCGALNGLVSGLTAGKGNAMTVKLTPRAVPGV